MRSASCDWSRIARQSTGVPSTNGKLPCVGLDGPAAFAPLPACRWCYYKDTERVLGQTFGLLVLQDFEVRVAVLVEGAPTMSSSHIDQGRDWGGARWSRDLALCSPPSEPVLWLGQGQLRTKHRTSAAVEALACERPARASDFIELTGANARKPSPSPKNRDLHCLVSEQARSRSFISGTLARIPIREARNFSQRGGKGRWNLWRTGYTRRVSLTIGYGGDLGQSEGWIETRTWVYMELPECARGCT